MPATDSVEYIVRSPEQRFFTAAQHVGQVEDTFQRSGLADPEGENSDALAPAREHLARVQADLQKLAEEVRADGGDPDAILDSISGRRRPASDPQPGPAS